jgi:hypothetical protein
MNKKLIRSFSSTPTIERWLEAEKKATKKPVSEIIREALRAYFKQ